MCVVFVLVCEWWGVDMRKFVVKVYIRLCVYVVLIYIYIYIYMNMFFVVVIILICQCQGVPTCTKGYICVFGHIS